MIVFDDFEWIGKEAVVACFCPGIRLEVLWMIWGYDNEYWLGKDVKAGNHRLF
jgi:hypothetical protein